MNDTFVLAAARALAVRLRNEAPGDARDQVVRAWRILFARTPREGDVLRDLAHITEQAESFRARMANIQLAKDAPPSDPELDALASLCQVLLGSSRFLYVE